MNLKQQIISDLTTAMKAKDALTLSVLRMLKAEIMKFEVSGNGKELTDEDVFAMIKKGVKQRKEAAEGFKKGGNEAAAQQEMDEMVILEKYLPEQMSEEEVKKITKEVIDQMGAGPGDFGKIMGAVMGRVKGQADGNVVSKTVKELLN